jgi:hypothetical protein
MAIRYGVVYSAQVPIQSCKVIFDDGLLTIEGFDKGGDRVATVVFNNVILTQVTDEGARLRLIKELGGSYAFVVSDKESRLLAWLKEEGLETRDFGGAGHFIIFAGEEVVDVVSFAQPEISMASKSN